MMTSMPDTFFRKGEFLDEFRQFLATVRWSDRSPLNTELFFLWSMIRSMKPSLFIESGTFRGYSAEFICEAIRINDNDARFFTHGFDMDGCIPFARERLRKYRFATIVEGDSRHLIGRLKTSESAAFFIDGPKGSNMVPLFYDISRNFTNIQFIAVHDCERESGSHNRWYVERFYGMRYVTMYCGRAFQTEFSYLDEPLIDRSEVSPWRPFHIRGRASASYGTETGYVLPNVARGGLFTAAYASVYRLCRFRLYDALARALGRRENTRWSRSMDLSA